MSCPWYSTAPSTRTPGMRSFMRFRHRRRVLLPHPEGPMSAVTLFTGNSMLTSASARFCPYQKLSPCREKSVGSEGLMMCSCQPAPACPDGSAPVYPPRVSSGAASSGAWHSVTLNSVMSGLLSPGGMERSVTAETLSDGGGYQVEAEDRSHQHDDRCGRVLPELGLRPNGPVVYLDRHRREVIEDTGVVERNEAEGTDHDQGRRLADGSRERQDDSRDDARHRLRKHMVPYRLPAGGSQRQR